VSRPLRLLVIEDEPSLRLGLVDRLSAAGYEVTEAADGLAGETLARAGGWDLVVLDVMLPRKGGFEVCRDLRQAGFAAPILMLTARGEVADRVRGLELGADDYLTKPFAMQELVARIAALLRRAQLPNASSAPPTESFTFGAIEVDLRRAEVRRHGTAVHLTALELALLADLWAHRGEVVRRDELLDRVWRYGDSVYSRTVDVHVAALRQKLEADPARPRHLLTVRGLGYKLVP
jgi:DNA-binding response OmpR family regulator